ncbi:MAG: TIGR02678 family protein [Acetatifactor muris]|nr:TIGR02678 family protein [Acetatifactor muris]MCM1528352.1 TIGR02678 family protein [Bacteroides sp.]
MNEARTLFENFWICKDSDKETYYRVKRDIPNFQRFIREQLGWKLIHTENLLKLEKKPAHAQSFMGIEEFTDIRDYCILCAVLMYLEDKEEQEQFLLSELINYVETQLKAYIEIDWTSFTQRKSLVRVLQYMERLQMLRAYEGNSEAFGAEAGQEVLYENTGYSKYFATGFVTDVSSYESWEDFEKTDFAELDEDRGAMRINRVYRQLAVCPAYYWEGNEDADALYLKNQRQWVSKYLNENLGGNLDIYKNAAFLTLDADDCYGAVHPRDAMLPEAVLLLCAKIQEALQDGNLKKEDNECICLTRNQFAEMVSDCRNRWNEAWSKEFREMDEDRLPDTVLEYMKNWMMLQCDGNEITILPAVGRIRGYYPKDFEGGARA